MRHLEKRQHHLDKIAENLKAQRTIVFKESEQKFAERFVLFGVNVDENDIIKMESGDGNISIEKWICAWQVMQVSDAVIKSTKSDAALYLAATQIDPGIEIEMFNNLNKNKSKGD